MSNRESGCPTGVSNPGVQSRYAIQVSNPGVQSVCLTSCKDRCLCTATISLRARAITTNSCASWRYIFIYFIYVCCISKVTICSYIIIPYSSWNNIHDMYILTIYLLIFNCFPNRSLIVDVGRPSGLPSLRVHGNNQFRISFIDIDQNGTFLQWREASPRSLLPDTGFQFLASRSGIPDPCCQIQTTTFWLPLSSYHSSTTDAGFQILATRSWLKSATRSWLPGPGYQIPDLGYQILATTSWLPHPGCQILDIRPWLPDSGC